MICNVCLDTQGLCICDLESDWSDDDERTDVWPLTEDMDEPTLPGIGSAS